MSSAASSSTATTAGGGAADLGFYFQGDIQRRLETSKPVRRTRVDGGGAKKASADDDKAASTGPEQQQYLFKWQREAEEDADEGENAAGATPMSPSAPTGASAKWSVITGNVPASMLSIAVYFDPDGTKGKPIREIEEGMLVNAGGVILLQPGSSRAGAQGGNTGRTGLVLDETKTLGEGGAAFNSDDLLLRATLDDHEGRAHLVQVKEPQERLWFKHVGAAWPPEAPAFPPPPPNLAETVGFKKVPKPINASPVLVKRLSRVRPDLAAARDVPTSREGRDAAMFNTPQYAAAMAGGASRGVQEMVGRAAANSEAGDSPMLSAMGASGRKLGSTAPGGASPAPGGGGAAARGEGSTYINRQRAPSSQARDLSATPKKPAGGILRRLSFMPSLASKNDASAQFQGVYAVYMQVPYVLPPPPEPRKPPPAGSNAERQQQRVNIKLLFLEDAYSQLLEAAEEKILISQNSRYLESQITEMDIQIAALIGSGPE